MNQDRSGLDDYHAIIVCAYWPRVRGGIGRSVLYLTTEWKNQEAKFRYRVVDPRGNGHILLCPIFVLRSLLLIFWDALRNPKTILHINICHMGSTARKACIVWFARMLGVPYILHLRSGTYHLFYRRLPRFLPPVVANLFRKATQVIVLGDGWHDFVCKEMGVSPNIVTVLPNAVAGPARDSETLAKTPDADVECRILFLGNLDISERDGVNKGVFELVHALASEGMRDLRWTAIIAGHGDGEPYKALATKLGVRDRITFPGWLHPHEVAEHLAGSDMLVLPSHNEGLPNAVIEAMAYGLPVISTPVGAIPEVVADGISGLLVPPGDADALADALVRLVPDADTRRRFGMIARERYEADYEVSAYANRIRAIHRRCLELQN